MAVTTTSLAVAVAGLARADPVLAGLVARHGSPPARRRVPVDRRFGELVRNIVHQQLAGRAAASIHGRFVQALDGDVGAARVLATPEPVLRACGLSGAKAASILDLADKVGAGRVALDRIGRLPDDEVVAHLTVVRGVGRRDGWPRGDYGVRAGFARAWGLPDVPTPKELESRGEPFRPHRSLVAWYCWRAADER